MTANDVIVGDKRLCLRCMQNVIEDACDICLVCRHEIYQDYVRGTPDGWLDDHGWAELFVKVAERLGDLPMNLRPKLAHALRTVKALGTQ